MPELYAYTMSTSALYFVVTPMYDSERQYLLPIYHFGLCTTFNIEIHFYPMSSLKREHKN